MTSSTFVFQTHFNLDSMLGLKTGIQRATNSRNYDEMSLKTTLNGVGHTFGIGGLHGAIESYYGEGLFIMADVSSYYPAMMIEYDYLSRNVSSPKKYRQIRDERLEMKARKRPKTSSKKDCIEWYVRC